MVAGKLIAYAPPNELSLPPELYRKVNTSVLTGENKDLVICYLLARYMTPRQLEKLLEILSFADNLFCLDAGQLYSLAATILNETPWFDDMPLENNFSAYLYSIKSILYAMNDAEDHNYESFNNSLKQLLVTA